MSLFVRCAPLFRLLFRAALLLFAALMNGCVFFPKTDTTLSKSGWEHSNLYNSRSPYPKLHVEIDHVEGEAPSADELRALKEFLQLHCDKPDGITLKIDNIIPKHVARNRSAESLVLEYLNGAPDEKSALLYILFYNGKLRKNRTTENPSFSPQPHPVVYIDRSYHAWLDPYRRTFRRAVLLHETGHALGLCADESAHGSGGHCKNSGCLMYSSLVFHAWRFVSLRNPWNNNSLCEACRADLTRNRVASANPKFEFWRGYFRRNEEGYQVTGLPGMFWVHFGEPLTEITDGLTSTRQEAITNIKQGAYEGLATVTSFEPWDHLDALARWAKDSNPFMQPLAEKLFRTIATQLEELPDEEALGLLTDAFIASAEPFPEHQAQLIALRQDLSAPAGYGAQLSREPRAPVPAAGN